MRFSSAEQQTEIILIVSAGKGKRILFFHGNHFTIEFEKIELGALQLHVITC